MRLVARSGESRDLFCKVNDHTPESIVALSDFPIKVGPPELTILKQSGHRQLLAHLPRLHWFVQRDESRTVLFMEALGRSWHPCTSWSRDLALAAKEAAVLQQVLTKIVGSTSDDTLINYGREFSEAINDYAYRHLTTYADEFNNAYAKSAVSRWGQLTSLYLSEPKRGTAFTVIHGDYNTANIFLHVNRRRAKVLDWEWAGIGDGYRDLAALLKRAPRKAELRALRAYHQVAGGQPDLGRYERAQLERGLLDAAFLSVQLVRNANPKGMRMDDFIRASLQRAFQAEESLAP